MGKDYEIDGAERFWIGPKDESKHVVYSMQSNRSESKWYMTSTGTELDPDYSEYSVRIHNRNICSLHFVNTTIAILPKSMLRAIYNLIGKYLEEVDNGAGN